MDLIAPPFRTVPGAEIAKVIDATPAGGSLRFRVETTDISGDPTTKTVRLKLGDRRRARPPRRDRDRARFAEPADRSRRCVPAPKPRG